MRVLGIDPGSRFTGYGVVEDSRGQLAHVAHGVIRTDAQAPLEQRLQFIHAQLTAAIALHRPETVAVEGLFSFRNARSALVLGHARGVALLVAAQTGLAVAEYSPAKVKRAVGANGASGKDAVERMVRTFLSIDALERADASDALAVAICHANHSRGLPVPSRSSAHRRGAFQRLSERLSPAVIRFPNTGTSR